MRTRGRRVAAVAAGVLSLVLAVSACSGSGRVSVDVPAQVDAKLPGDLQTQLEDATRFAMAATGSSAAIVGVWAPWSGSWVAGVGQQSATDAAPVTADMDFRIADVTRAMTCDALYRVAASGTVGLDDSVTKHVSGVPGLTAVTLRSLCDGNSSLGSYTPDLLPMWLNTPARVWDSRELLAYGLGHSAEAPAPGGAYDGSDAGYVLLGLALEAATGRSAASLLHDEVFDPLGLESTRLPGDQAAPPQTTGTAMSGHHSLPGADGAMNCAEPLDVTKASASMGFTDSGVVSNLDDLHTYVQALAAGALTEPEQGRFDQTWPAYGSAPSWFTVGGGAYQAGPLIGQQGWTPGYATAAYADPASGLSVVVVLNNSGQGGGVASALALELAALASKAPAASGETAPQAGLPWTPQQFRDQIAASAICPLPAP